LKQPENSIPSFADLLLKYDMVTQDQLNEAYRFMEEKKTDGESYASVAYSSLEEVMLFKKILTQYQVNLIQVVRDFLVIKKKSDHFGYVAVQKGYATPQEVKHALKKQLLLFREKKIKKMIGDILVEAGVLTKEQQQIIVKEQQVVSQLQELNAEEQKISELKKEFSPPPKVENNKAVENIEDQTETVEVIVSPNAIDAWIKVVADTNTSDSTLLASTTDSSLPNASDSDLPEPMLQKKPITLTSIKATLKKNGVISGILSDAILQCHIDRKDSFFPAAVGEYLYSDMPEYEFNLESHVGDTLLKKNKTVAFLKSDKIETRIEDVYGRRVEFASPVQFISSNGQNPPLDDHNSQYIAQQKLIPDDHPVFRCGNGVTLSEDGMRVLSNQSGYPAISVEGRLHILPVVNVIEDADMRFGPVNPYASLNVAGILTGAYPVNAGQVKAREIHGAALSSIGDISVEVGIIGSRIKTQGSIRAKYIHNSWIEAFGDVVVEHEILDSTIIISGRCNSPGSRILASRISAKSGIIVAAVGSYLTEPSDISAGCEEHIVRQSLQITRQINSVRKELDEMMETKENLEHKIKETFKNMVELKGVYDRAKAKSLEFSEDDIDIVADREENGNTTRLLDDLETKMKAAVDALKRYNRQKKILELRLEKTENTIKLIKPKVEKEILQLELDRNRFFKWAETITPTPEIRVYGRLAEGTRIKGLFASMTIEEDVSNVRLFERRVGRTLDTYEIQISSLKEF